MKDLKVDIEKLTKQRDQLEFLLQVHTATCSIMNRPIPSQRLEDLLPEESLSAAPILWSPAFRCATGPTPTHWCTANSTTWARHAHSTYSAVINIGASNARFFPQCIGSVDTALNKRTSIFACPHANSAASTRVYLSVVYRHPIPQ